MSHLKFAVMGAGFWSHFQIPAWFEVGGVELVAIYNRTVSKAEAVAAKFNIPRVYGDPEEMLRNEELDFVDIITEVPGHAPLVLLAAQHKLPVICQKPMAGDYATCQQMVQACREAGVPFAIHENFRWQAPMRALKQVLDKGTIGQPFRARIQFIHGLPAIFENQPFLKELERFAFTDVGSHLFDLARFFFGEAQSIYAQTYRTRDDIKGEDVASAMLRIGDLICTCDISYSSKVEHQCFPETLVFIEGKKGTIELAPGLWLRVTTEEGVLARQVTPPYYPWADPRYAVVHASIVPCNADLLDALKHGRPAETSGEDNLKTMRLVYAAYESAAANQVVHLS
ncbi:MAG TPA: Gfo/Idh/MocA family oxidoreductase [Caldilineaceae bacterium]|nr:Gfo/Idh/MocA family oxidoreductase [Caldilineaceae bacterium]